MQQDVLLHFWAIWAHTLGGPNLGGPNLGGPIVGGPDVGGSNVGGPDVGGAVVGGPNVGPNKKGAQNRSWTQTGQIIKKSFHLSALELFCCLPPPFFCCLLDVFVVYPHFSVFYISHKQWGYMEKSYKIQQTSIQVIWNQNTRYERIWRSIFYKQWLKVIWIGDHFSNLKLTLKCVCQHQSFSPIS